MYQLLRARPTHKADQQRKIRSEQLATIENKVEIFVISEPCGPNDWERQTGHYLKSIMICTKLELCTEITTVSSTPLSDRNKAQKIANNHVKLNNDPISDRLYFLPYSYQDSFRKLQMSTNAFKESSAISLLGLTRSG